MNYFLHFFQAQYVVWLSMNAIYLNFVTVLTNPAPVMCIKWTVFHAKWVPHFVIKVHVEPIQISVDFYGVHLEKNQTISVMNKTRKVHDMEIVAMIVLTIRLFSVKISMSDAECYIANI